MTLMLTRGAAGLLVALALLPVAAQTHTDHTGHAVPAPTDARDPNAYAGDSTLTSGPYARPGPRELVLADEMRFGALRFDRLERVKADAALSTAYEMQAWYGSDVNRVLLKAEGDWHAGKVQDSRTELLWSRPATAYWDTQLGLRHDDGGDGPGRNWLAFGVQGLAPYWFEVDATAYLGEQGRTALRVAADIELLLTQRLVLQPGVEVNLYGNDDTPRGIGRGLSDASAGLRLRYEFSRQFAPYLGAEWTGQFGHTAELTRAAGASTRETRYVAGVRFWF
jgi:copper resistance protein B